MRLRCLYSMPCWLRVVLLSSQVACFDKFPSAATPREVRHAATATLKALAKGDTLTLRAHLVDRTYSDSGFGALLAEAKRVLSLGEGSRLTMATSEYLAERGRRPAYRLAYLVGSGAGGEIELWLERYGKRWRVETIRIRAPE